MFRLLSRNGTLEDNGSTDEELLQEMIDQLKIELEKDLENQPEDREDRDYEDERYFPRYKKAVHDMATRYKGVNSGFRKLALVPSFMQAMVMLSRVQRHFVHAPWFRVTSLLKMVGVHGGVSAGSGSWKRLGS